MIPIHFKDQILPGTFEYPLNHIIDNELELTIFEPPYKNDDTGAPAFDPVILLKIILYAYSRGITSSLRIARCCEVNIIFAVSDSKHQVIVHGEAFGAAREHDLLEPMVKVARDNIKAIGKEENVYEKTRVTADSGFHNEENMKMLSKEEIDGYVADTQFRKRDPRFATAERHKKPIKKEKKTYKPKYFTPRDFKYDKDTGSCICPAGNKMWLKSKNFVSSNGFTGVTFMGRVADCSACKLRKRCIRKAITPAKAGCIPGWNDKGEGGQLYKEDDKEDGYGRGEADIEQEDGGDRACICKYTLNIETGQIYTQR